MNYNDLGLWRHKYNHIYQVRVADETFIVRPLILYEVLWLTERHIEPKYWLNWANEPVFEYFDHESLEDIVRNCILWPKEPDLESKAGIVSAIFGFLFHNSLLSDQDIKNLAIESENKTQNKLVFMKAMVLAAFPAFKPLDVDELNLTQIFDMAGLATLVLKLRNPNANPSLEPIMKAPKKTQGIDFEADNAAIKKGGPIQGYVGHPNGRD